MNTDIRKIIENRALLQTLGSGGVGKTTLSVVLGVLSSRLGKKTLVITIDPSKRLMDTLHIKSGQDLTYVEQLGIYAMMIDVSRSWEMILRRYAPKEVYEKIIRNRFNNYLKDYFPGFDEYIASEMIYHMINTQDYDVVVVDSPPSTYAISYLEASHRVIDVLSNDFILSLIPYIHIGSKPIKFLMRKEIFILNSIARFTGMDMLIELIKFINDLSPLLQGFKRRADFIKRFYNSKRCGFIIVTLPNDVSFYNTEILLNYLRDHKYQLDGIFVNRFCSFCGEEGFCNIQDEEIIDAIKLISDIKLKELIENHFLKNINAKRDVKVRINDFVKRYKGYTNIFAIPDAVDYIRSAFDIDEISEGIKTLT